MSKFISIILLLFPITLQKDMQKERILFFGDSITEFGLRPNGYITVLNKMIAAKGQQGQYELVGAGVGGNKVYDLYLRMEEDVLDKAPFSVVIWIGVNDVWHKQSLGTGTDADKFERFYIAIIKKLVAKNIRIFLCTPAVIGEKTDHSNPLDADLDKYAAIIRNLATTQHCTLIDFRQLFLNYNIAHNKSNQPSGILTEDGVHLNDEGNALVATEMMKVLIH